MSCAVGHRRGSDCALLWLWCRPASKTLIPPLAWEPSHAVSVALKRQKKKKKKVNLFTKTHLKYHVGKELFPNPRSMHSYLSLNPYGIW